jgi:2',3'-cyclic-nucleotide 2'-phosphodiesterase (5'-nucleotidase family)
VARRATVIGQEREKGEAVLVLDAGDSLVGDQNPANRTRGESSVAAMNLMGYDAMALGPADLALGLETLGQRIDQAEFATLSANAVVSATGELVAAPYLLRQFDDHLIAIIGLSGGPGTQEIAIRDPLDAARKAVDETAPRADIIIFLSHAGPAIDQQIANTVPGVDLIISGGQFQIPTPWRSQETGALVVHADEASPGHAGRRLGIARLTFDDQGLLVEEQWKRLELGPEYPDDSAMRGWVSQQMTP